MWSSFLIFLSNVTGIGKMTAEEAQRRKRKKYLEEIRFIEKKITDIQSNIDIRISNGETVHEEWALLTLYKTKLKKRKEEYEEIYNN